MKKGVFLSVTCKKVHVIGITRNALNDNGGHTAMGLRFISGKCAFTNWKEAQINQYSTVNNTDEIILPILF